MRYLEGDEIKEAEKFMKVAAECANLSTCKKSKRGVAIVQGGIVVGLGYNRPTIEELCNPCIREQVKDNSRVELCSAIHAEQMAILDTVKGNNFLKGSRMYYIKVKDGEMWQSGKPSCTVCSRQILESGIAEVVLWHKEGYALYASKEFNELSFKYFMEK